MRCYQCCYKQDKYTNRQCGIPITQLVTTHEPLSEGWGSGFGEHGVQMVFSS